MTPEELRKKVEDAVAIGKITKEEAEYYLNKVFPQEEITPPTQKTKKLAHTQVIAGIAIFIILGIFAFVLTSNEGITGLIAWEPQTIDNESYIPLDTTTISKLAITGTHTENFKIELITNNGTYLVHEYEEIVSALFLEKESYGINESVVVVTTLENYTLWLSDETGNQTPVNNGFTVEQPGNYILNAITNETKESIAVIVRNDTNESPAKETIIAFTEICIDTCVLDVNGNTTLHIITEGTFTLEQVTVYTSNNEPTITNIIPDRVLGVKENITINLSEYFADEDELSYEYSSNVGVHEIMNGNLFTLTGINTGTYTYTIYASDLVAITQQSFDVIVNEDTTTQEPTTNNTTNTTSNQNNQVRNDCSHPDPNKRPLECVQETAQYYPQEATYLEHQNRGLAARITAIGNMQIRGDVVESTTESAPFGSWVVYFYNEFGQAIPVAWVEENSGDLHLTGQLYEEQTITSLPKGVYTIQNRQSINLAYIDRETGNMYIRGNIIPGREVRR